MDRNKSSKFPQIAKQADTHLLVRARIEEDMDMLKKVVPSLHVETDPSADYSFRAVVTRKQFKKFLAEAVDGITYDSHFKEVADKNSTGSKGRYAAMMSVWSSMARLQPYSPYSGYYRGPEGSKSTTKGSGYVSPFGVDAKKKTSAVAGPGFGDMDSFMEAWNDGEPVGFRSGQGPRTGFAVGDEVEGYFGSGVVQEVSSSEGKADLVRVTYKDGDKERTSTYLSNYLIPAGLEEVVVLEDEEDDEDLYDLEWMLDSLLRDKDPNSFDPDLLGMLDDDAFELLTRLQEKQGEAEKVSQEVINEVYEDVLWESADDETKKRLIADSAVPEKHVAEAMTLFSHKD